MKANHRIENIDILLDHDEDFLDGVFFKTAVRPQDEAQKVLEELPDGAMTVDEWLDMERDYVQVLLGEESLERLQVYILSRMEQFSAALN